MTMTYVGVNTPLEERKDRYRRMLADKEAGMSLARLGEKYHVSRERVRQILAREPLAVGTPVSAAGIDRRRERLLARREGWAKRDSEAARARVAAIDAELASLT
jgi:chloramphenicol 3-O-phosphotransferase